MTALRPNPASVRRVTLGGEAVQLPAVGPLPAAHFDALAALADLADGRPAALPDLTIRLDLAPQPPAPWVPPWLLQLVGATTTFRGGRPTRTALHLDKGDTPPLGPEDDALAAEILAAAGVKGGPDSRPVVLEDRGFLVPGLRVERGDRHKIFALVSVPGALRALRRVTGDLPAVATEGDAWLLDRPVAPEDVPDGVAAWWPAP